MTRESLIPHFVLSLCLLFATCLSTPSFAQEKSERWSPLGEHVTELGNATREQIELLIDNPEILLSHYQPEGVKVKEHSVSKCGPRGMPRVRFLATVQKMMIKKTVEINGDLRASPLSCGAGFQERGYRIHLLFDESSSLVSDNASEMRLDLCLKKNSGNEKTTAVVRASLKDGPNPCKVTQGIAKEVFAQQTSPLVKALGKSISDSRLTVLYAASALSASKVAVHAADALCDSSAN